MNCKSGLEYYLIRDKTKNLAVKIDQNRTFFDENFGRIREIQLSLSPHFYPDESDNESESETWIWRSRKRIFDEIGYLGESESDGEQRWANVPKSSARHGTPSSAARHGTARAYFLWHAARHGTPKILAWHAKARSKLFGTPKSTRIFLRQNLSLIFA